MLHVDCRQVFHFIDRQRQGPALVQSQSPSLGKEGEQERESQATQIISWLCLSLTGQSRVSAPGVSSGPEGVWPTGRLGLEGEAGARALCAVVSTWCRGCWGPVGFLCVFLRGRQELVHFCGNRSALLGEFTWEHAPAKPRQAARPIAAFIGKGRGLLCPFCS